MEIGTEIEHYVVVDHIGRGGMADVWAARDTRLNRMVAIKTIARNLSDEEDYLTRFTEEAQTIAELEHPHILPIYGFGEFEHQLYIIMRYVSGGTLFDRLVDGAIAPDEVIRIGRALAAALDYAHSRDVVHLDLKPANVLIDAGGIPYLADFGLSARVGAEGLRLDSASGSIGYMAPEQVSGGVLNRRADVFSFGVMLYEMLAGELPFGEHNITAVQIMGGMTLPDPAEKVAELPATLCTVLQRATLLTAEERFDSAGVLMDALVEAVEPVPGEAALILGDLDFDVGEVAPEALARLEAQDLFFRALHVWGQGQGQFVLGMTDFMLVNGYYRPGGELADTLDEDGRRMMLRGAIEYNHDLELWQQLVEDLGAQREVCLHVLRNGLPAARACAIDMLAYLPDDYPPVIVRRVARNLGMESDEDVRAATVALMGTRGGSSDGWRRAAYAPAIDERLAEQSLLEPPSVAEAAARTVGRLRSVAGVEFLAGRGATGALALVRDETPHLPRSLPRDLRARAFAALTWRKIRECAMAERYVVAAAAGMLAVGGVIFVTYRRPQAVFLLNRLFNTIGLGVPGGLLIGLLVLLTMELPERLHRLWAWWARVPVACLFGWAVATVPFVFYYVAFLNIPDPPWGVVLLGGLAMGGAFALADGLNLPLWGRVLLALVVVAGLPLAGHHLFRDGTLRSWEADIAEALSLEIKPGNLFDQPLIYFDSDTQALFVSVLMGVSIGLGAYLPRIPYGRLALAGGLATFAGQAALGFVIRVLWGAPADVPGAVLGGLAMLAAYVMGGVAVAALGQGARSPVMARHAALSALAGAAVFSLLRFLFVPPAYGALPADLHGWVAGFYLAQMIGGPLLAGAVAVWLYARAGRPAGDGGA